MDGVTAPDAPTGYQAPYEPPVAPSWLELLPGEIGMLVGTAVLFGWMTTVLRSGTGALAVVWQAATLGSFWNYVLLVVAIGITMVLHEAIHVLTAQLLGCRAWIERGGLGLHARLQGGFLSRRDDVLITLAPAVGLTVVGLPLLVVVDSSLGAAMVMVALIANAAGTGSDLATVLELRRLPPGTLLYYGKDAQLAYEPAVAAG
jgi:hypothetical protein